MSASADMAAFMSGMVITRGGVITSRTIIAPTAIIRATASGTIIRDTGTGIMVTGNIDTAATTRAAGIIAVTGAGRRRVTGNRTARTAGAGASPASANTAILLRIPLLWTGTMSHAVSVCPGWQSVSGATIWNGQSRGPGFYMEKTHDQDDCRGGVRFFSCFGPVACVGLSHQIL